jgi:DNA-binding response OmpR family regulator
MRMLYQYHPDAVIIYDEMPLVGGKPLHTRLRELSLVPIVIIGDMDDLGRAMMIEDGADLYFSSSVTRLELVAHLRSLIYRYHQRLGGVLFNVEKKIVALGNMTTRLTTTEFRLLSCLIFNQGRVLPYALILAEVWGKAATLETVHLYIRRLKQKLGIDGVGQYRLLNRRGEGYCFCADTAIPAFGG